MNPELKSKLRFTLRNFGVTIQDFNCLNHRAATVKWARLLNELRQDSNSNPIAIELVWLKFKTL